MPTRLGEARMIGNCHPVISAKAEIHLVRGMDRRLCG